MKVAKNLSLALLLALPFNTVLADDDFFESKIRPILVKRCYECHSGEKTKGGLALDTRAGWQKGGDSGPAIVLGKPDDSLLIKAVRFEEAELAFKNALRLGRSSQNRFVEANALLSLGWSALQQEHFDQAQDWSDAAYKLSLTINAGHIVQTALGNQG